MSRTDPVESRPKARSAARLTEASFKDQLTGLYNRQFFEIRLEEEVRRFRETHQHLSLVLLHLDGAARPAGATGVATWEDTLRAVAGVLLVYTRRVNVIARCEGALFAVLMPGTALEGARQYADRIRSYLAKSRFSRKHHVVASFGMATLSADMAETAQDLFSHAEAALREGRAKRP